jgi:bla regulator protein BlaR1
MITHTLALINDSLSSIAPSFANHLWQSTAFALAAWLVTLLLRSNAARVRYAIWLAASLKFLLPFSLLVSLGALLPRPQHVVATAPIDTAVDAVALPFSDNTIDIAPMAPHPTRTQVLMRSLPEALAVLWLAGALVVLTVWLARWRRISATRRRATPAHTGLELEILRRLQASTTAEIKASSFWRSQNLRIGLWNRRPLSAPTTIPLLLSPDLMEPGIVGILHPALLWPERLSSRLDDPHIEAILAHELMHVRRRDNLAAALHMLVETLFWFHPLVWYIERRMVEERERACDQAVVQLGSAPGIYADSLLKACRFCVESPLACVSGITGADLNRRVRSIMTLRLARLTLPRKLLLMSLALAAIAAPIAFGVLRAPVRIQAAAQSQTGDWMNAAGGKMSFDVAAVRQNKSVANRP